MSALHPEFAEKFIEAVNDSSIYPIAPLVGLFWKYAPQDVVDKYLTDFKTDPEQRRAWEERYIAEPYDFEALGELPVGSLGRTFYRHVVDHKLDIPLATGQLARERIEAEKKDDEGLPPLELRYIGHRKSQTHDIHHIVTGFTTSGSGEIALQAFDFAQMRYPYGGAWITQVAARMTYIDPNMIVPLMDAITSGWSLGRAVRSIQFAKWEEMFDRPLIEVRREYGIAPEGRQPLVA